MSAPDVVVRIGAARDRSVDVVLSGIERSTAKAFESVRREARKTEEAERKAANAIGGERTKQSTRRLTQAKTEAAQLQAIERAHTNHALKLQIEQYKAHSALNRAILHEQMKRERESVRASKTAADQKAKANAEALARQERDQAAYERRLAAMRVQAQREENRARRNSERDAIMREKRYSRDVEKFADRTSHRATRFFFPRPEGALGYGKRVANDIMRGAGIDWSLSSGVASARAREDAGVGLAQQERIAVGDKAHSGSFWAEKSLQVGTALKTDPAKITEMIREFTGKTGDFEAMVSHAEQLASITMAAGANMGEMGSAAGFVYNQLKELPDAAELTLEVMRRIVGQTAVGAVEMEEYASQMGRIAANAKMFQGDVTQNIKELSALTQLSIAEGGATSGADAARSIAAFSNTTSKGQRIRAFRKYGVELFNEQGTQKRPILDIIRDSLFASNGNIEKMTNMWADTLGQKPIRGLTNAFNAAGGGETGWQAALDKIKPFLDAQIDRGTEKKNLEDYASTMTARAIGFQNEVDRITESMTRRLAPALEELAPKALKAGNAFADIVAWAASNPGEALAAGGALAVGRAGAESLGRYGIEKGVKFIAGSPETGGNVLTRMAAGGVAGQVAAGASATLGALAVGAAAFTITNAVLNSANTTINKDNGERQKSSNDVFFDFTKEYSEAKTDEDRAAAVKRAKFNAQQIDNKRGLFGDATVLPKTLSAIDSFVSQSNERRRKAESIDEIQNKNQQSIPNAEIAAIVARELTGQLAKGLNVRVVNTDDFPTSVNKNQTSIWGPPTYSQ